VLRFGGKMGKRSMCEKDRIKRSDVFDKDWEEGV
jgi:hypothetical protein